jgi:pimeloyl-ACP methyl ester carboxylesterase
VHDRATAAAPRPVVDQTCTAESETSMTTQTPARDHGQPVPQPTSRGRRSVTPVVAASVTFGFVAALVCILALFPGADEATTTGSVLMAYGLGWAALWRGSIRYTDQPQRWAAVPAAFLGLSGLALLVVSPRQGVLAVLTWVWPPLVLALVVWMWAQMLRHLSGRGRWLLTPVFVFLAAAGIGASVENVLVQQERAAFPAPGKTYEVDGRRVHLDCRGHGGPTVVLFNGMGEISSSWGRISKPVSRTTRVCACDRAGQAWSDDAPAPQDGVQAVADLHQVLAEAGEQGPFVLTGHSIGGLYAMIYAQQHPDQVAGMVLLDSTSPHQFTAVPAYPGQYAMLRRTYSMLTTLSRLGTGHLTAGTSLTDAQGDRVRAMSSMPREARNIRDEVSTLPTTMEEAQRLRTLHGAPLVVVTASESLEGEGWGAAQDAIARLSDNVAHREVSSSHMGLIDDVEHTRDSVRAVMDAVTAVRTGQPLDDR